MSRPKKDLLGASSHHKKSTHAKDNLISVTVRKDDPSEKAGIRLALQENGRVVVTAVAKNGLFAESEVEVGDIVLSINGKRLRKGEGPEALVNVVERAEDRVTAVVKKANMALRKDEIRNAHVDRGNTHDNNKESKKSYQGTAVHNADGSLKLAAVKTEDKNAPKSQIAIAASKSSKDEDDGIELQVQDKKLFVVYIDGDDSIFAGTDLEVGDRVVSINDMNFRSYADAKYAKTILKKAEITVTIVVEKGHDSFTPDPSIAEAMRNAPKKKKKAPSTADSAETSERPKLVRKSSKSGRPGACRSKSSDGAELFTVKKKKKSLKKSSSTDDIPSNSTRSSSKKSSGTTKRSSSKDRIARTKSNESIPKSSTRSSGARKKKKEPAKAVVSDAEDEDLMALLDTDDNSSSGGSFGEESSTASLSDSLGDPMPRSDKKFHKETTVTAPKDFAKQEVGVSFVLRDHMLIVSAVNKKSIFMTTSLDVGDRVLSINNEDFRINPDQNKASLALKTSKEAVSLVVQKAKQSFKKEKFDLDGSTSNLVW